VEVTSYGLRVTGYWKTGGRRSREIMNNELSMPRRE